MISILSNGASFSLIKNQAGLGFADIFYNILYYDERGGFRDPIVVRVMPITTKVVTSNLTRYNIM